MRAGAIRPHLRHQSTYQASAQGARTRAPCAGQTAAARGLARPARRFRVHSLSWRLFLPFRFVILVVGQHGPNIDLLTVVMDGCDKPSGIAADVKDREL